MIGIEPRMGVTVSALCLAIVGAVLLFAPVEAGNILMPGCRSRPVLMQLIGAALLGYGIANWTARGAALGGIYGRAVVAGNQAHLMIGALLLLKHGIEMGAPQPAYLGVHYPVRDRSRVLLLPDVLQLGAQTTLTLVAHDAT